MNKLNLLALTLTLSCIPTYKCFAPHNKKKVAATAAEQAAKAPVQAQVPQAPVPVKETQAFKYLRELIVDAPASWMAWSKTGGILNLLRQKQLQAALAGSARTRTEHDLDWAIRECMNPAYNGDLTEMFMRCAEQDVRVNDSSLQATFDYSGQEMQRELLALKKIQDETFARIRKMKALRQLVKQMRSSTRQDEGSDVEDYDAQHIFDKTRVVTAPAEAPAAAPLPVVDPKTLQLAQ